MAEVENQLAGERATTAGDENDGKDGKVLAVTDDRLEIVDESLSETDEIDMVITRLSSEEVATLLEPAISRTATHYKSAKTPAIEKSMILEEAGDYFDVGLLQSELSSPVQSSTPISNAETVSNVTVLPPLSDPSTPGVSPSIPITPWKPGPKKFEVQDEPQQESRSILKGVFGSRARSVSGGAQALKRMLPKGVPSIGGIFSPSSTSPPKNKSRPPNPSSSQVQSVTSSVVRPGVVEMSSDETTPLFEPIANKKHVPNSSSHHNGLGSDLGLRRSISDNGLYQSMSRASSLGDDARFEDQTEMVNSRSKAIRDSWQDRTSFRMPQMPSIPSMPRLSDFSFTKSFNMTPSTSPSTATSTDVNTGILSAHPHKRKPSIPPSPPLSESPDRNSGFVDETMRSVAAGANTEVFDAAIKDLTGDVVIMGGYRGSILRSTKSKRQVWVPVKVGLNIRKVDLEVGLRPEDDERMEETIYSSGMLQNIGPVDISKRLFKRLREMENAKNGKLRVWDYGYDWRLSPHFLSRKLEQFLKSLPSNGPGGEGALVIAHSLGGLITRHVINRNPELVSGVIYAGTPHGCVNILGPLRNGDAVMLSSRVLTAQVNFTLRTSFLLLPEDGNCFIDINTSEKYPVDFFNVEDWIKYRLSPCTDPPLPPRNIPTPRPFDAIRARGNSIQQKRKSMSFSSKSNLQDTTNDIIIDSTSPPPSKSPRASDVLHNLAPNQDRTIGMQMDTNKSQATHTASNTQSVSTIVTIPRSAAITYLTRILSEIKLFKQEMHLKPLLEQTNRYPPAAIIYGKSIPTVFGAKVDGREGISCSDSYDNLAFASGDGVCLAKEAMLPKGYKCVSGGRISSDRGHVTLLGDLNAVGKAIEAVTRGRARGIGIGLRGKC